MDEAYYPGEEPEQPEDVAGIDCLSALEKETIIRMTKGKVEWQEEKDMGIPLIEQHWKFIRWALESGRGFTEDHFPDFTESTEEVNIALAILAVERAKAQGK